MLIKTINSVEHLNTNICIHGWIRTYRKQNDLCFFNINDGSNPDGIQVVVNKDFDNYDIIELLGLGSYVKVEGKLITSPAKEQDFELQLNKVIDYGLANTMDYPIKKNTKLDSLRLISHLRPRTNIFGCVNRIRNTLMYETHNFFQNNDFMNLDPNIITINECEGGAGVFTVTELMGNSIRDVPSNNGKINYKKDHFKQQAYLTVSSQLQLEALACSMGNVYTMNKSFRAEHSNTNKHVSEFTHLEIEMIDCTNNDLMDISEKYIKFIIQKVFEKNIKDIQKLNQFSCKGLLSKYDDFLNMNFHRVTYDDAIELLLTKKMNINYGDDLSSDAEHIITQHYEGPVFVYNWPLELKSFYMKQSTENDILCYNFDLLMPYGIGELIGGSMREDNYDKLLNIMNLKQVSIKSLKWYLDLRQFGTVIHGGFGLGLDRFLMLLTGIKNIKDVIPFPVYYENCNF